MNNFWDDGIPDERLNSEEARQCYKCGEKVAYGNLVTIGRDDNIVSLCWSCLVDCIRTLADLAKLKDKK